MRSSRSERKANKALRYTIYLIKTRTPNFFYVGWAKNCLTRWRKHREGRGSQFTKEHGVEEASILCQTNDWKEAEWREKLYAILLKRENPTWVVSMGLPLSTFQVIKTLKHFGILQL